MPCQNAMDSSPATLKISEKVRKYHFFPRKSMFVFLKNSIKTPSFKVSRFQGFKVVRATDRTHFETLKL
jgi:hypothetical protein